MPCRGDGGGYHSRRLEINGEIESKVTILTMRWSRSRNDTPALSVKFGWKVARRRKCPGHERRTAPRGRAVCRTRRRSLDRVRGLPYHEGFPKQNQRVTGHEAHVSAEQSEAEEDPRLPCPDAHQGGSACHRPAPQEGAEAPLRVTAAPSGFRASTASGRADSFWPSIPVASGSGPVP